MSKTLREIKIKFINKEIKLLRTICQMMRLRLIERVSDLEYDAESVKILESIEKKLSPFKRSKQIDLND